MAWKLGNGANETIGIYPWVDNGAEYKLLEAVVKYLCREGIFDLAQENTLGNFCIGRGSKEIGIEGQDKIS